MASRNPPPGGVLPPSGHPYPPPPGDNPPPPPPTESPDTPPPLPSDESPDDPPVPSIAAPKSTSDQQSNNSGQKSPRGGKSPRDILGKIVGAISNIDISEIPGTFGYEAIGPGGVTGKKVQVGPAEYERKIGMKRVEVDAVGDAPSVGYKQGLVTTKAHVGESSIKTKPHSTDVHVKAEALPEAEYHNAHGITKVSVGDPSTTGVAYKQGHTTTKVTAGGVEVKKGLFTTSVKSENDDIPIEGKTNAFGNKVEVGGVEVKNSVFGTHQVKSDSFGYKKGVTGTSIRVGPVKIKQGLVGGLTIESVEKKEKKRKSGKKEKKDKKEGDKSDDSSDDT